MKDEVKLAHIFKALVQSFYKNLRRESIAPSSPPATHLNQVKDAKFRLAAVNAEDKVESGIVTVDQLVIRPAWRLYNIYVAPMQCNVKESYN